MSPSTCSQLLRLVSASLLRDDARFELADGAKEGLDAFWLSRLSRLFRLPF